LHQNIFQPGEIALIKFGYEVYVRLPIDGQDFAFDRHNDLFCESETGYCCMFRNLHIVKVGDEFEKDAAMWENLDQIALCELSKVSAIERLLILMELSTM